MQVLVGAIRCCCCWCAAAATSVLLLLVCWCAGVLVVVWWQPIRRDAHDRRSDDHPCHFGVVVEEALEHMHRQRLTHTSSCSAPMSRYVQQGNTPAQWAAQSGHAVAVKALVKAGANAYTARQDGATALALAVLRCATTPTSSGVFSRGADDQASWRMQARMTQRKAVVRRRRASCWGG